MADPDRADEMDKILGRFGEVQEAYDHLGGYALEAQAREVLHGLGFDDERIDGDVGYPGSYVEYVERTGHEAPGVRG